MTIYYTDNPVLSHTDPNDQSNHHLFHLYAGWCGLCWRSISWSTIHVLFQIEPFLIKFLVLGNYGGIPFTAANTNGLQQAVTPTVSTNQTRADGQPTMYTTVAGTAGQTTASGVPAEQLSTYLQVSTINFISNSKKYFKTGHGQLQNMIPQSQTALLTLPNGYQ